MSKNAIYKNHELRNGDFLESNNGKFRAFFQDDGNFVIYTWKPTWASDTDKTDATRLILQEDCNLVMYNKDHKPRWQSNSSSQGCTSCRLQLNDDGNLVLSKDGIPLWTSANSKGMK
ncbi:B-type lectin plumieribetin-like isoform X2 [Betta splendens]|nr:B-type lectin plumieribetin-like isoform X2 [Betta splendens]